jgi:hypothetical protein
VGKKKKEKIISQHFLLDVWYTVLKGAMFVGLS